MPPEVCLREAVHPSDRDAVRRIVTDSGFFTAAEVDVAVELVDERLAKGEASGYEFLFADQDGAVAGYACYGEIACTVGSYDLYWVAVDPALQRQGLGRRLVDEVERRIAERQGRKAYIETSSRALYEPTRQFYLRCGYREVARFPDFYAPEDDKVVYEKSLSR
ncbi:MAG: GNAT family N-acetyltransferase [Planctomyces sp.]|nr:GNAT family N-acetyltransferase [Planctomyces sp.]